MENEYIFGIHAVRAAIKRGRVRRVCVLSGKRNKRIQGVERLAAQQQVGVDKVTVEEMSRLVGDGVHQGVVAEVEAGVSAGSLEDLLDTLERPFLLVLDGVTDPHNLGACLRVADAAGVHAVIAPKDKAASITPTVRKVASGAAENIPYFQVTNLARTLKQLQERGIWVYGASDQAEKSLYDVVIEPPLAVVLGAEGKGIRRLTAEHCDELLSIPMFGSVESLNVSVATGICLYEVVRNTQQ